MKVEIKNAILEILSDDATVTKTLITDEDFTWVFDYVKANAEAAVFECAFRLGARLAMEVQADGE